MDLQTLKKVNADLISTIEETIKIQQEGRTARPIRISILQYRTEAERSPIDRDTSEEKMRGPRLPKKLYLILVGIYAFPGKYWRFRQAPLLRLNVKAEV